MFQLNHILAPIDASDSSLSALKICRQLARAYAANLHTTQVVPPIPPQLQGVLLPYAALGEELSELEQEMATFAQNDLRRTLHQVEGCKSPHPKRVICADLLQGILREIERLGPDLMVMGSNGFSHGHTDHLGSTARALLNTWEGPILLNRRIVSNQPIQRITIVTDFCPNSQILFRAGFGLALRLDIPLSILTIIVDPRLLDRGGLLRGAFTVDERTLISKGKRAAEQKMGRIMKQLSIPFPLKSAPQLQSPELVVRFGDPSWEISEHLGNSEGNLLVIGRSHNLSSANPTLGSTAEALLHRVPAHILVLPLSDQEQTAG